MAVVDTNLNSGWFFSPPVGPSKENATLAEVLEEIRKEDEHWSIEAPATVDEYCRENWAKLIFSDEMDLTVKIFGTIYYLGDGLFTLGLRGTSITDWTAQLDPLTGEQLDIPPEWFDAYPLANDCWNRFLTVSRQGNLYRYPKAVAVDRELLCEIVRCLFETQTLYAGCRWMTEMEYAREHRVWFYTAE